MDVRHLDHSAKRLGWVPILGLLLASCRGAEIEAPGPEDAQLTTFIIRRLESEMGVDPSTIAMTTSQHYRFFNFTFAAPHFFDRSEDREHLRILFPGVDEELFTRTLERGAQLDGFIRDLSAEWNVETMACPEFRTMRRLVRAGTAMVTISHYGEHQDSALIHYRIISRPTGCRFALEHWTRDPGQSWTLAKQYWYQSMH